LKISEFVVPTNGKQSIIISLNKVYVMNFSYI
jgi:hypothetical protein